MPWLFMIMKIVIYLMNMIYLIREIASIYSQKVEYDQLGGGVTQQSRYNKKVTY